MMATSHRYCPHCDHHISSALAPPPTFDCSGEVLPPPAERRHLPLDPVAFGAKSSCPHPQVTFTPNPLIAPLVRWLGKPSYPRLFLVIGALFVVDLAIPNFVPWGRHSARTVEPCSWPAGKTIWRNTTITLTMRLIDSHCHFDAAEFDADRAAVQARARAAGVTDQIVPAVDAAGWPKLKTICAAQTGLHPAYGLHPMYLDQHQRKHLDELRHWAERETPVAVGECGLDFFVGGLDADTQLFYFDAQLKLAREFDLSIIVHARRAVDAVIAAIRRTGGLRGVIHSFPGSPEQARAAAPTGVPASASAGQ